MRFDEDNQIFHATPSSSEEERDDRIHKRSTRGRKKFMTPYKEGARRTAARNDMATPVTSTEMTPSPMQTPMDTISFSSPHPTETPISRANLPANSSFSSLQQSYLDSNGVPTALFRDVTPSRSRRKMRSSSSQSRLSQSLLLDDYGSPMMPHGMLERRRSRLSEERNVAIPKGVPICPSPEHSSAESTPDSSPIRSGLTQNPRVSSWSGQESMPPPLSPKGNRCKGWSIVSVFLALAFLSSMGMISLAQFATLSEENYEPIRPEHHLSAAGLRGQMTSGHWEDKHGHKHTRQEKSRSDDKEKKETKHKETKHDSKHKHKSHASKEKNKEKNHDQPPVAVMNFPKIQMPPPITQHKQTFATQDPNLYATVATNNKRVLLLDPTVGTSLPSRRKIKQHPADFTDETQLYSILDSSDERLSRMEMRAPYSEGECVPMQDWQTTFHPWCNGMHEIGMETMGEDNDSDINLFGTKGFWRYAWRLDVNTVDVEDTVVLKTLKYEHNFEDAHFEHDRVDAIAMERLTSSPHVINVFGFCGHSVITEYGDGTRVGALADKSKKKPLARLAIASDIAHGLADVHGIDGDDNATFVHLDVNPANVVSVGGTLKLNDFNIGIIRRWNTTSNEPCGFPAQYPNPQWRSPEEARNEQFLTEKVDVFSMGHIFFRLICGHEPWNKLEPGGRPSKEEVNAKVQKGVLPYIPDHVQNSENPEVIAIRDAMLDCYMFDPKKRPSARAIANSLADALSDLRKSGSDSKAH